MMFFLFALLTGLVQLLFRTSVLFFVEIPQFQITSFPLIEEELFFPPKKLVVSIVYS